MHGQSCCKLDCDCLLTGLQVYFMHYLLSQSHSAQVGLDQLNYEPYIMKVEGTLHSNITSLASCGKHLVNLYDLCTKLSVNVLIICKNVELVWEIKMI